MKKLRPWAHIWPGVLALLLFNFAGLSAAQTAGALTELPSSREAPLGTWLNMIPKSYGEDIETVFEVCVNNAKISPLDVLTLKKCQLLKTQLTNSQCSEVFMSDKDAVRLSILNGLKNGKPYTWYNMLKQTGHSDRALLCDLGDGLYSYWFTGDAGKSCNNLAFVFAPPIQQWELVESCPNISTSSNMLHSDDSLELDSLIAEDCCCGYDEYVPNLGGLEFEDTLKSSGGTEECIWELKPIWR